jgi:hypothetical protein
MKSKIIVCRASLRAIFFWDCMKPTFIPHWENIHLKKDNVNKANVGIYKHGKNANRNQDDEVKLPVS